METGYRVGEVMTHRPIVIGSEADMVTCVQVMKKNHVGALLVTEDSNLTGILTEQDVAHKIVGENKIPKKTKVKDIMETVVSTISPEEDIFEALLKMREMNIRHLPVVEGDNLIGLLTLKDILKIQPQLFELIIKKFELREEDKKPINNFYKQEGICNLCGEYTSELKFRDDIALCSKCYEE